MKNILITAITGIFAYFPCSAQTWTLDSCINYALEHNINVRQRNLDKINASNAVSDARSRFLPTAAASASQSFNFGRGLTSENTYANRNTSNTQWSVGINVPLFQGLANVRQVAYSKASLQAIIENYEAAKDDVTLNIISQYLQALYCGEIHSLAQEQEALSTSELQRRKIMVDAGKIPEVDMLEAEAQLAQDQLSTVTTLNDYTMALVDLAQLMHLRTINNMKITPVNDPPSPLPSPMTVYCHALKSNHTILAGRAQINAADKQISVAQTGYIPKLNFNAGIGSSYYTVSGFDSQSFSRQMRDNLNTYLGFSLSIPIFDAFSTRNSVRRARVQQLSASLDLEQAEDKLFQVIQQSYHAATSAQKRLEAASVAVQSTHTAMLAVQEKYNVGRATPTEYESARMNYLRAKSQHIQAKYELMLRTRILHFYYK